MSKRLKLFGLLALVLALGAAAAWAALEPAPLALNGTYVADVLMNKVQAVGPSTANTFNTITGKGSTTGSLRGDVVKGDGTAAGGATPLVLNLYAIAGDKVEIAPTTGKFLAQWDSATAQTVEAQANGNLQVVVNGPVDLADNATSLNNGTILIRGANADQPTAALRNRYYGGTFVYGGTLETSQNNALGQTWVALMARSAASRRPGATFAVNGTTKVQLGIEDPASETTGQPVWLVRDNTEAGGVLQQAFINVDVVGNRKQELWLNHGLSEITQYNTAANAAGIAAGAAWVDTPVKLFASVPTTRAAAPGGKMVQLVKTGAGLLYIGSDGTGLAAGGGIDAYCGAIDGARHEGGTVVRGGTLKVDGSNAPVWQSRYTGYLGSVWNLAALVEANSYLQNSAGGAAAIHNPLYLENDGKVIVDRSQIFSFFRGTEATGFEANAFTLAGEEERPSIFVTLNREHSDFAGALSGNFDLVVDSKVSTLGFKAGSEVANDGQAVLTLSKADNTQQGTTLVKNGVLAVAGGHSIATAVPGTLTVGTGNAGTPDMAVFRANANAVFTSPTIVNGPNGNTKFQTGGIIGGGPAVPPLPLTTGEGALAALTGVTAEFTNVTINGSMQINPKAVREQAIAGSDESVNWMDTDSYVGWAGTVAFGVGENSSYDLGANPNNNVQVFVSDGIWHLGKLPDRVGSQANVVLRKGAALSLADGVRDFSPYFDVRFDDDTRLHVVVCSSDIALSREEAMEKAPIFKADDIDYTWLGRGESNKDKRIVLRLDISQLQNKLTAGSWIKVVGSNTAHGWNNLHHLRESSSTNKEDKVKVVVGFYGEGGRHITDIDLGDEDFSKLRPLDETGWAIMVPVMKGFDGTSPDVPAPAPNPTLTATVAPANGSTVKPGETVVFEVKDWKFGDAAVEVENVKWMLNGEDKTADAAGGKLTATAGADGTKLELKVSANVKGEPAKKGEVSCTVNVSSGGTTKPSGDSGSGGGCDAGFGALALALAAAFLLKRKA